MSSNSSSTSGSIFPSFLGRFLPFSFSTPSKSTHTVPPSYIPLSGNEALRYMNMGSSSLGSLTTPGSNSARVGILNIVTPKTSQPLGSSTTTSDLPPIQELSVSTLEQHSARVALTAFSTSKGDLNSKAHSLNIELDVEAIRQNLVTNKLDGIGPIPEDTQDSQSPSPQNASTNLSISVTKPVESSPSPQQPVLSSTSPLPVTPHSPLDSSIHQPPQTVPLDTSHNPSLSSPPNSSLNLSLPLPVPPLSPLDSSTHQPPQTPSTVPLDTSHNPSSSPPNSSLNLSLPLPVLPLSPLDSSTHQPPQTPSTVLLDTSHNPSPFSPPNSSLNLSLPLPVPPLSPLDSSTHQPPQTPSTLPSDISHNLSHPSPPNITLNSTIPISTPIAPSQHAESLPTPSTYNPILPPSSPQNVSLDFSTPAQSETSEISFKQRLDSFLKARLGKGPQFLDGKLIHSNDTTNNHLNISLDGDAREPRKHTRSPSGGNVFPIIKKAKAPRKHKGTAAPFINRLYPINTIPIEIDMYKGTFYGNANGTEQEKEEERRKILEKEKENIALYDTTSSEIDPDANKFLGFVGMTLTANSFHITPSRASLPKPDLSGFPNDKEEFNPPSTPPELDHSFRIPFPPTPAISNTDINSTLGEGLSSLPSLNDDTSDPSIERTNPNTPTSDVNSQRQSPSESGDVPTVESNETPPSRPPSTTSELSSLSSTPTSTPPAPLTALTLLRTPHLQFNPIPFIPQAHLSTPRVIAPPQPIVPLQAPRLSILPPPVPTQMQPAQSVPTQRAPVQPVRERGLVTDAAIVALMSGIGFGYAHFLLLDPVLSVTAFAISTIAFRIFGRITEQMATVNPFKARLIQTVGELTIPAVSLIAMRMLNLLTPQLTAAVAVATATLLIFNLVKLYQLHRNVA